MPTPKTTAPEATTIPETDPVLSTVLAAIESFASERRTNADPCHFAAHAPERVELAGRITAALKEI